MKTANLKIGQRFNIAFALSFAMLALVAGLGAARLAALGSDFDVTLNHHYRNIADLGAAQSALALQSRHLSHTLLRADAALAQAELDKAGAMVALGGVGGVLCMLTAWYITRGIVGPIRHAVKEIGRAHV